MTDNTAKQKDKQRAEKEPGVGSAPTLSTLQEDRDLLRRVDDPLIQDYIQAKNEFAEFRRDTISALPAFVVNNSSNFIASTQLVAEALYFKSSGNSFLEISKEIDGKKTVLRAKSFTDYVTYPFRGIIGGVFGKAKYHGEASDFLKPKFYKDSFLSFIDLDRATALDKVDKLGNPQKLTNHWSARSGFSGIVAMTVATLLPDEKDDPKQVQEMARMSHDNPLGYYGLRFYQALNPLEWMQHKRQFSGLGMMGAGLFSAMAGLRQVEGTVIGHQKYGRNPWQVAGGLITVMGGTQLMMGIDNTEGWTNYGKTQMVRLFTLPNSIANRFKQTEQGAEWYFASTAAFQTKNVIAATIGGAEKKPDGTVIDKQDILRDAKRQAAQEREAIKENLKQPPLSKISHIKEHTPPDRELVQHVS